MKQTIGRFLLQSNKSFPVDCETLDALQTNIVLSQVLGNIAGDKAILLGCEPEQGGTHRKEGYVFLKTKDFPDGEVIRWEGGAVSGGMYVHQEHVPITAQGYEFEQAYTVRSLRPGIGQENYKWDDFTAAVTPRELKNKIAEQEEIIKKLAPPPLGIIQMWAGAEPPKDYYLCDGRPLKISEYPELFNVLGNTFNNAYSAKGSPYKTSSDEFRLPDLQGRFIVGRNEGDDDYKILGTAGGEKQHKLTIEEMPSHSHEVKDYYFSENEGDALRGGRDRFEDRAIGSAKTDHDNHYLYYLRHNTEQQGNGAAHENRPPYYVLAYIMRVR